MSKKVVILGGGYAGVKAALTLYKKKKKNEDIDIVVIDKNSYHTLLTELHEVAGNRIPEGGIIVPLKDIFKYTDVEIIKDEIINIDFNSNKLISEKTQYEYDYLIIAAGSEPNFYDIEGMKEHSLTLWSYDDAIRIREHIKECFFLASSEKDAEKRKELLTFVVGGGGYTGVEIVGELTIWVKALCREYGIPRSDVRLVLIEALPNILSNLKDKNIARSTKYMQKKGIEILLDSPISRVFPDHLEIKNKAGIKTRTLIWTAGVRASCITDEIDISKGKSCRLKVDGYSSTQHENVFAAGDIAAFISNDDVLPALVETALQTGETAARNILADIRGKEKEVLKPNLHGVMVSIGSYFAVSEIMGKQLPVIFSIILKYMVNIHYLFGIGGFELVIKYIKHEFLYKKQPKTIIEDHISVLSPTFWLVPIRLWLGYSWLTEGISKIREGWFEKAMLAGLPADANSSASATETGEKVFRIITDTTPQWYAWIADTIIIPNALFFQVLIILAEVGLGLAFLSGTFTFIAGIVSIAMNINFLLSTGLYDYNYWYIPAALVTLGGSGKAFGLDYYLIPYLKRQWNYFVKNKRIKLFLFR